MFGERSEFYYTAEEYYARADSFILKTLNEGRITEEDKRFIDEFICEKDAEGISPVRHYKIVVMIIGNRKYHPPFSQCTISDVQGVIKKIKEDKLEDGTPRYKYNTIADRLRELKRFFIWLQDNGYSNIELKKLQKIRPPAYDRNTVKEDDILTEEEIQRFLSACPSNRDRALFWMLYEGAFRVGEIGQLKFEDVKITDKFLRVSTDGKTGKIRYIPLILSRQHYVKWVNEYPNPITQDSYVFLNQYGKPLTRDSIAKQMRIIGKKAGIEKDIYPHLFRHSRITHLLQGDNPMPESHLKLLAWGDVNTGMLSTYQHLTSMDLEKTLARINGMEIDEDSISRKHKRIMKPIICKNCGTINSPGTSLCEKCGTPLNETGHDIVEAFKIFISNYAMNNPGVIYETNVGSKLKEAANIFDQEKQPNQNG